MCIRDSKSIVQGHLDIKPDTIGYLSLRILCLDDAKSTIPLLVEHHPEVLLPFAKEHGVDLETRLKAAQIDHSNMALHLNRNNALPDHGDEDGEIAKPEDKKQYDMTKIQEWPEFNVDFDNNVFNDETDMDVSFKEQLKTSKNVIQICFQCYEPVRSSGYCFQWLSLIHI